MSFHLVRNMITSIPTGPHKVFKFESLGKYSRCEEMEEEAKELRKNTERGFQLFLSSSLSILT